MNERQKELYYIKVANFEGFRSRPYIDPTGRILTIGYGHTVNVKPSDRMTLKQAREQLQTDMHLVMCQLGQLGFVLEEHELWAISDLVFNIGFGAFKKSSLPSLLEALTNARQKNFTTYVESLRFRICDKIKEFRFYHDKAGNKRESSGLFARRTWEANLFMNCIVYSLHEDNK